MKLPRRIIASSRNNSWITTGSALPSPALTSLHEALTESCLPTLPTQAYLPQSFRRSTKAPPLLGALAHATLPTSSLSPPSPPEELTRTMSAASDSGASYSLGLKSSPSRTSSIDTLRRFSTLTRRLSSSAPSTPPPDSTPSTSSSGWWWFQGDNKDNVDALLNKDDRADTYEDEQNKLHKKYLCPKNPIVFCHGLLGFDSVTIGPSIAPLQVTHWRGIKEVLEANGATVLITRVPATSSPVDRAKVLEATISKHFPGRSVHLIGHSMGGLDCRYLTTHLTNRNFTVCSVTTIATPHRGSSFADYFLQTVGAARMPSILSLIDLLPNGGGDGAAFEALTIANMAKFNETTPDVPGVAYFSWGASYEPGLIDTWRFPHSILSAHEGPNDGIVSVKSSMWGTYKGTLQNVNHLDLVGWINVARYKWAELTGRKVEFRPGTFYLGIADMLARDVEGQTPEMSSKVGQGAQVNAQGVAEAEEDPAVPSAEHVEAEASATSPSREHIPIQDIEAKQRQKRGEN